MSNVLDKISDKRFSTMSAGYENEQNTLKTTITEFMAFISNAEQKSSNVMEFIKLVRKYEHIETLTLEMMHSLSETCKTVCQINKKALNFLMFSEFLKYSDTF